MSRTNKLNSIKTVDICQVQFQLWNFKTYPGPIFSGLLSYLVKDTARTVDEKKLQNSLSQINLPHRERKTSTASSPVFIFYPFLSNSIFLLWEMWNLEQI